MKHLKTISALTASSLMAFTMVATPVFADDPDTSKVSTNATITLITKLDKGSDKDNVNDPNADFTFVAVESDLTPSQLVTLMSTETEKGFDVNNIGEDANDGWLVEADFYKVPSTATDDFNWKISDFGEFSKEQTNSNKKNTAGEEEEPKYELDNDATYARTFSITESIEGLTPGIYYFDIKEAGDKNNIDGVSAYEEGKEESYTLAIAYAASDDGTQGVFKSATLIKADGNGENLTLTKTANPEFEAVYNTGSLMIKKQVTGTLGDKSYNFNINYLIIPSNPNDDEFVYSVTDKSTNTLNANPKEGTVEGTAALRHDGTLTIHGLSPKDKVYIIEPESENTKKGYKVAYSGDGTLDATGPEGTTGYDGSQLVEKVTESETKTKTETVTNTKDSDNPITGIVHNYGPFALMAAIGAALIGFFFRRRREE